MPRGSQLGELINAFREETGHANSRSLGKNELPGVISLLRRTYRRLHADFSWPHLVIQRDKTLVAGGRYYSFPADIDFTRLTKRVKILEQGHTYWRNLDYGIGIEQYNIIASDEDAREDFPYFWDQYEDNQFEVWPIPASNGHTMRFEGISKPQPLIAENEIVDLDDDLIVLYAAAEQLARDGARDAEIKLALAKQHYNRLKGNSQNDSGNISMRAGTDRGPIYTGIQIPYAIRGR